MIDNPDRDYDSQQLQYHDINKILQAYMPQVKIGDSDSVVVVVVVIEKT